jgi:hypothetical protein
VFFARDVTIKERSQDVHVRCRVEREGKCAEAAALAGLPGGDAKREHELVCEVAANGDIRFKVFAHFCKCFLCHVLGWHSSIAAMAMRDASNPLAQL